MEQYKFCRKCTLESGNESDKQPICYSMCSQGKAECTKFDLEKVANDIPEIIGKDADKDKVTLSKKNISSKGGKLYLHGESRETDGKDIKMELKKDGGVWMFEDESHGWTKLSEYLTSSLYEQTLKEQKEICLLYTSPSPRD